VRIWPVCFIVVVSALLTSCGNHAAPEPASIAVKETKTEALVSPMLAKMTNEEKWGRNSLSQIEFLILNHWKDAKKIDCVWRYNVFIEKFQSSNEPIAKEWIARAQLYRDQVIPIEASDSLRSMECSQIKVLWNRPLPPEERGSDSPNVKEDNFGHPGPSRWYVLEAELQEVLASADPRAISHYRMKYEKARDDKLSSDELRNEAKQVLRFEAVGVAELERLAERRRPRQTIDRKIK
jgi:hypothetical protein